MSNNGRNADGTFAKGNKAGKKPFEKEIAQDTCWREIQHCINVLTSMTSQQLKEKIKDNSIMEESVMTYAFLKKAAAGDTKSLQWLAEMICGKPRQQIEQLGGKQRINIEFINANTDTDSPE